MKTAAAVGCDLALAAVPLLVTTAAAVGAAVVVEMKRRFKQPAILWGCVVAETGDGKTPGADAAHTVVNAVEDELAERHKAEVERFADHDGDEKKAPPVREYFLADDISIERLVENLGTSPRGVVVAKDELAGWFGSFSRYKGKDGGTDVDRWLSIFEAKSISYQRKTGQPRDVRAKRPVVNVFGGIQPAVLCKYLQNEAYVESGLAARLLFCMPPRRCLLWTEAELDQGTEARFEEVIRFLRCLPFHPKSGPAVIRPNPVAKAAFVKFNDELMTRASDMEEGPVAAAVPKIIRYALRLALVYHCASHAAEESDPARHPIGERSMAAGIGLARWFLGEAERVYALLGERPEDRDARRLVDLIRRKGGRIKPRDLQRANPRKYPAAEHAEAALDALAAAGMGGWDTVSVAPQGGRPSRLFTLSPALPDSRQNPTPPPRLYATDSEGAPDKTPTEVVVDSEFSGKNEGVSGFVGCRARQTDASEGTPPAVPPDGVMSGSAGHDDTDPDEEAEWRA